MGFLGSCLGACSSAAEPPDPPVSSGRPPSVRLSPPGQSTGPRHTLLGVMPHDAAATPLTPLWGVDNRSTPPTAPARRSWDAPVSPDDVLKLAVVPCWTSGLGSRLDPPRVSRSAGNSGAQSPSHPASADGRTDGRRSGGPSCTMDRLFLAEPLPRQPIELGARQRTVTLPSLASGLGSSQMPAALLVFESRPSHDGAHELLPATGSSSPRPSPNSPLSCDSSGSFDGMDAGRVSFDDQWEPLPNICGLKAGVHAHVPWLNSSLLQRLGMATSDQAAAFLNQQVSVDSELHRQVAGFLKGMQPGSAAVPTMWWSATFAPRDGRGVAACWLVPCVLRSDGDREISKGRHRAALLYVEPGQVAPERERQALLRDHISLTHSPCMVLLVDPGSGQVLSQNAESVARMGCRQQAPWAGGRTSAPASSSAVGEERASGGRTPVRGPPPVDYVRELFYGSKAAYQEMEACTLASKPFKARMHILSPTIKRWLRDDDVGADRMPLGEEAPLWHRVHLTRVLDPTDGVAVYCIAQEDVSCEVLMEQQVLALQLQQQALLKEILPPQVAVKILASRSFQASNTEVGSPSCGGSGDLPIPRPVCGSGVWLTQQDVMELATYHDQVTVLFADIEGFTSMSEALHPSAVILFLNQLYSVFDSLLDLHDVYKVETIGDSYMVAGGLFGPATSPGQMKQLGGHDPLHAQKVVNFGAAMLEAALSIVSPFGTPVSLRVGCHSGPCASGVVGQKCPRFCLFGDTINTASRMETLGRPGALHASQATHDLLPYQPWRAVGGVHARGKGLLSTFLLYPLTVHNPDDSSSSSYPAGHPLHDRRSSGNLLLLPPSPQSPQPSLMSRLSDGAPCTPAASPGTGAAVDARRMQGCSQLASPMHSGSGATAQMGMLQRVASCEAPKGLYRSSPQQRTDQPHSPSAGGATGTAGPPALPSEPSFTHSLVPETSANQLYLPPSLLSALGSNEDSSSTCRSSVDMHLVLTGTRLAESVLKILQQLDQSRPEVPLIRTTSRGSPGIDTARRWGDMMAQRTRSLDNNTRAMRSASISGNALMDHSLPVSPSGAPASAHVAPPQRATYSGHTSSWREPPASRWLGRLVEARESI